MRVRENLLHFDTVQLSHGKGAKMEPAGQFLVISVVLHRLVIDIILNEIHINDSSDESIIRILSTCQSLEKAMKSVVWTHKNIYVVVKL